MILYFAPFSPPARTVLMTIQQLKLNVEVKVVDFQKGENKSEEFVKLNPIHQVPVLVEDDGFILTESRAIAAYLVSSRNPESTLYPKDPVQRAKVDEKLYYDATAVFRSHIDILHPMVTSGDPKIPDAKRKNLENVLATLNSFLSETNWFAGDAPTLADISILSNILVLLSAGVLLDKYSNLKNWYERCKSLEGFQENYEGATMVAMLLKSRGLPPLVLD